VGVSVSVFKGRDFEVFASKKGHPLSNIHTPNVLHVIFGWDQKHGSDGPPSEGDLTAGLHLPDHGWHCGKVVLASGNGWSVATVFKKPSRKLVD